MELDLPTPVTQPSYPGKAPAQPHGIPTPKSMFASIKKMGKLIEFAIKNRQKIIWQIHINDKMPSTTFS
jgi:hypothetical protein